MRPPDDGRARTDEWTLLDVHLWLAGRAREHVGFGWLVATASATLCACPFNLMRGFGEHANPSGFDVEPFGSHFTPS